MSDVIAKAVEALNARLAGGFAGGIAKFVFDGEGAVMLDAAGARAGDESADVTLIASSETFVEMLAGEVNPTVAFMTGRLSVEGNMGLAIALGAALS